MEPFTISVETVSIILDSSLACENSLIDFQCPLLFDCLYDLKHIANLQDGRQKPLPITGEGWGGGIYHIIGSFPCSCR